MNDMLLAPFTAPFTAEDVKKAIDNIGDLKGPGPDGLHAIFHKKKFGTYLERSQTRCCRP